MQYTALELINDILTAGDADTVSTIGETEESQQVLNLLNRAILYIEDDIDWVHNRTFVQLDTATSSDTSGTYPAYPWAMGIPAEVDTIYTIYYNDKELDFEVRENFLYREKEIGLRSDGDPKYWSIYDEDYVVMDSFDSDDEDRLSSANSYALVSKYSGTKLTSDTEKPGLPDRFYSALIAKGSEYYHKYLSGNLALADREQQEYMSRRAKLMEWAKKARAHIPYYYKVNLARRVPHHPFITDYTDVSV